MSGTTLPFLRKNARWLGAGAMMTGLSTFGQTSFISLYSGEIRDAYALTDGAWGLIYAAGTLGSAALMLLAGGLTDRFRARDLASVAMLGLALTALVMWSGPPVAALPLVILGLRFFGQGWLSHVPTVAVGRWFSANRGVGIAASKMGFSVGEATLPVVFVALAASVGWQGSWVAAAAVLLLAIPILRMLLRTERHPRGTVGDIGTYGMQGRHWTRGDALRHWLFWALIPPLLAQPVFATAFFFQQVHLVELKGWNLPAFVGFYPAYTLTAVGGLILGGVACDRLGVRRVAPFMLMPMVPGLVVAALFEGLWAGAFGLMSIGLMAGLSNAVTGTLWPELYGTRHLGSIRAVATSLMVFATAIGPAVTGLLIDAGVDYRTQLIAMACYATVMGAVLAIALRRAPV